MEPNKKVKVTVVIRSVSDHKDKELANNNGDGYLVMNHLTRTFEKLATKEEEQDVEAILRILEATKTSNEVMASALADVGREDLFDEKVTTNKAVDEIINQIVKLNQ
jgi:hypothetical protein